MSCHYFEEDRYRKICRAKGQLPPTYTELRLYCYKNAYSCPTYQAYIDRVAQKIIETKAASPLENWDLEPDQNQEGLY